MPACFVGVTKMMRIHHTLAQEGLLALAATGVAASR